MNEPLITIPTQEFKTRTAMLASFALGWNQKRYVVILKDSEYGDNLTLFLFTSDKLILIAATQPDEINGLPDGGTIDQVLVKKSNNSFDAVWKTITDIRIPVIENDLLLNDTETLLLNDTETLKLR